MSQVIKVPDQTYAELTARAKAQGISVEELITQLVKQDVSAQEQKFWEDLRNQGVIIEWPTPAGALSEPFEPITLSPSTKQASDIILEDRR